MKHINGGSTPRQSRGVAILLDLPAVCAATTLKKSKLYQMMREGEFPAPIKIGNTTRKAWVRAEVEACINSWIDGGRHAL